MYNLIKPILFSFDPERIHELSSILLEHNPFTIKVKEKPITVCGIKFKNPIGLAAGFDKNARLINSIHKLGFGFTEVGTITPKAQIGSKKPRLFRDIKTESIINRMGFNNDGVDVIAKRLEKRKSDIIIGANIGKGFETPLESANLDYLTCFIRLRESVDYFTLNLSSPNTPGLKNLMKGDYFTRILDSVQNENYKKCFVKPVFVKISPDLEDEDLINLLNNSKDFKVNGIILTNTLGVEGGGLSGGMLSKKSFEMSLKVKNYSDLVVMGSGGIMSINDAKNRLGIGCDLIQIYSGLIYRGPFFIQDILENL